MRKKLTQAIAARCILFLAALGLGACGMIDLPKNGPDLVVDAFDVEGGLVDKPTVLRATVRNVGNVASAEILVGFRLGGEAVARKSIVRGLLPGESVSVERVATLRKPQKYLAVLELDSEGGVAEQDEENNRSEHVFGIGRSRTQVALPQPDP